MKKHIYLPILLSMFCSQADLSSMILVNGKPAIAPPPKKEQDKGKLNEKPKPLPSTNTSALLDNVTVTVPNEPGLYVRVIDDVGVRIVIQRDLTSNFFFRKNIVKITFDYEYISNQKIVIYHPFVIEEVVAYGQSLYCTTTVGATDPLLSFDMAFLDNEASEIDVQFQEIVN